MRIAALLVLPASCATLDEPVAVQSGQKDAIVSPVLAAAGERTLKRKVIVARFSNETLYGKSVLHWGDPDLIGRQAMDNLMTRLAESDKFVLHEMDDAESLIGGLEEGNLGELGLPADFLILGSVTEFGRETTGETGFMSRTKTQRAHARVNVRLVDVRSSRVIYATTGAGEAVSESGTVAGFGTKAAYDSTLNDKAISAAIAKVVGNLVENLLDQPWQSYVLHVDEDEIVIAGGESQGLRVGERLDVWVRGKRVHNPQNNTTIELDGERVATLEIVRSPKRAPMEEISICRVVSGAIPEGDLATLIVREKKNDESLH